MTTERNLKQELNYYVYNDPEYAEDIENLDYECLIKLLGEILSRLEALENSKTDVYKDFANALKQAGRETLGL